MDVDLLVPAAGRVTVALAGALGCVVVAERHHLRSLRSRLLWLRWRTWAVTAPLFGIAVAGPALLGSLFAAVIGMQAAREFGAVTASTTRSRRALMVTAFAAPVAVPAGPLAVGAVAAAYLLTTGGAALATTDPRRGFEELAKAVFGFVYIPCLLLPFVALSGGAAGSGLLLAVGVGIAASDVVAFTLGTLVGRKRLCPAISPNKTVAGAWGNIAGAYLGMALLSSVVPAALPAPVKLLLPALVGIAAIGGDLTESLLKRAFGVKDTGTWLPGFGGMLDRIDSLLVALPLVYLVTAPWL